LFYANKVPASYFPYFFSLGSGLLGALAGMGLLAVGLVFKNAFRRQWRRALAWLLLAMLGGGSAGLGYFPVVLVVGASIADDGHQND
jgi:H+/Cl- antiporter ClcA